MGDIHNWSSRTGLQNLKTIIDGDTHLRDAMGDLLNLKLVDVESGTCAYEGRPQKEHLNPRDYVHGGWVMSILDAAAVMSVVTVLPEGQLCATSTFEVKFVRPLQHGTMCRAEGEMVSIGKNLAHCKARLIDTDTGKLIAFCTCSTSLYNVED